MRYLVKHRRRPSESGITSETQQIISANKSGKATFVAVDELFRASVFKFVEE